MEIFLIAFWT